MSIHDDLLKAIAYGDDSEVKQALQDGADPNYNIHGTPPLFLALYKNKMDIFFTLLAHPDIDINQTNDGGFTLLSECFEQNNNDLIDLLLDKDLFLMKINRNGEYPIHEAIKYGKTDIVKKMLTAKPHLINLTTLRGDTPFIMAAKIANEPLMDTLYAFKPDLSMKNSMAKSAIDYLRKKGLNHLVERYSILNKEDNIIEKEVILEQDVKKEDILYEEPLSSPLSSIKSRRKK